MLRKILIIGIFMFLSNCSTNPSTALLGPFISGVKSGSVYQASLSYGSGKALEDIKKEIKYLRKKLNNKILLVIDDAYFEYMKNKDYQNGLSLFKNSNNVFILRTFSKIYGLAGLRVGWGYSSNEIIKSLN